MNLRELPSVDQVVESICDQSRGGIHAPRTLVVAETRRVLAEMRTSLLSANRLISLRSRNPSKTACAKIWQNWRDLPCAASSTRPEWCCIPTWGARPFLRSCCSKVIRISIRSCPWPSRQARHAPRGLARRLVGKPAIASTIAAAALLALHELAAGGEAIVSRGELIEIGDGFRIPDIMAASGASLREVGTTNRTNIDDYRSAISERTRVLMRVHPSNSHIEGFTSKPGLGEPPPRWPVNGGCPCTRIWEAAVSSTCPPSESGEPRVEEKHPCRCERCFVQRR